MRHGCPMEQELAHETFAASGDATLTEPILTEPVLAIHGISSQRKLWLWLHEAAPEIPLLAPDLRGRGASVGLGGPYGMDAHVADLIALLDARGLDRVHVVGMSMGGFIAVHLAARHPERVRSLVLVDGGPPMATPPGLTPETLPMAFVGRAGRLAKQWPSLADYRDYFCDDIAPLLDRVDPLLETYLEHDLDDGRVRLDGDALAPDAAEIWFGPNPWEQVSTPTRFLHAQWSVGEDSDPAYGERELAAVAAHGIPATPVDGVDHAGIIMSHKGARAVATVLREALADVADDAPGSARTEGDPA